VDVVRCSRFADPCTPGRVAVTHSGVFQRAFDMNPRIVWTTGDDAGATAHILPQRAAGQYWITTSGSVCKVSDLWTVWQAHTHEVNPPCRFHLFAVPCSRQRSGCSPKHHPMEGGGVRMQLPAYIVRKATIRKLTSEGCCIVGGRVGCCHR
jgi:hypothetical protein